MAQNFTASIDTVEPASIPGTSIGPDNPIEGLDTALGQVDEVLTDFVVGRYAQELGGAETDKDAFLYEESRELKRKVMESGERGDQEAVVKHLRDLERLKVAERQGAIGPGAVETRRMSTTKEYISRFPHLANEFKQAYNAAGGGGGGGGASSREQFEDPTEKAFDKVLQEYQEGPAQAGMSLKEFNEHRGNAIRVKAQKDMLDLRQAMGQASELDLTEFSDGVRKGSLARLNMETYKATAAAESLGEFNAATFKLRLQAIRDEEVLALSRELQERTIYNKDARGMSPIVSRDFIRGEEAKLIKMWDDRINSFEDLDQLKNLTRNMQILGQIGLRNVAAIHPWMNVVATLSPNMVGTFLAPGGPLETAFNMTKANLASAFKAGKQAQGDTVGLVGLELAEQIKPETPYIDFLNAVATGKFTPKPGMSPIARAATESAVTDATLASPSVPPEIKRDVARAHIAAEKEATGRRVSGSQWYLKDNYRTLLQSDPEIKREVTQGLSDSAQALSKTLAASNLIGGITFAPDPENDGAKPWEYYPGGGPFAVRITGQGATTPYAAYVTNPSQRKLLKELNDGYFQMRVAHGPAKAEAWASDVLEQASPQPTSSGVPKNTPAGRANEPSFDDIDEMTEEELDEYLSTP